MGIVKVTIAGHEYKLNSNENDEYVVSLSRALDTNIKEFLETQNNSNVIQACVIAALSALDDKCKMSSEVDKLRLQLKEYMDDAAQLEKDNRRAQQDLLRLTKENEGLWRELKKYQNKD